MALTVIENLLAARIGFDIHTVGPQAVDAAIRQSMEEAGFSDQEEYAQMLVGNPDAWNRLVDRAVIPETWFFRDIAPFELAANLAITNMRRAGGKVLRILSCPSSTGEEPYSAVMTLLHAGAPPESFTVDAVDVSRQALESARSAVFRTRSFRENALWFRAPYFDYAEGTGLWHLKGSVVSLVRFRHGNLIAPDFLEDDAPYDMVLCRNLLIYLHPEARTLAMTALRRLVAENGVLVLGHAEAAFAREQGFTPTGPAAAFAFIKNSEGVIAKKPPASPPRVPASVPLRSSPVVPAVPNTVPVVPVIGANLSPQETDVSLLTNARQLGDGGQLHDALQLCTQYLQRVPDSAEGHFLLGVLHDALGQVELAVRSFRKVLYLDPTHREALLHLALKKEALGDDFGAALLRARARRVEDAGAAE